jgi:hypothetical protein
MFETRPTYDQVSTESNKLKMRTRSTKGQHIATEGCTEFTMHVSQQTNLSGKRKHLIDYSQYRLMKYIDTVTDAQQRTVLIALLHDYIIGDVALAWKRGQPVYISVTKA